MPDRIIDEECFVRAQPHYVKDIHKQARIILALAQVKAVENVIKKGEKVQSGIKFIKPVGLVAHYGNSDRRYFKTLYQIYHPVTEDEALQDNLPELAIVAAYPCECSELVPVVGLCAAPSKVPA